MTQPPKAARVPLDLLLTDLATRLMGITAAGAQIETETVLDQLVDTLGADTVFLRRNDLEGGRSTLVALRSSADAGLDTDNGVWAEPDVAFESTPVLGATATQTEPAVIDLPTPGMDPAGPKGSLVTIPLVQADRTVGVLGVVDRAADRRTEDQIRTLLTIATLFAHLWGRLEAEEKLARQVHYDELTGLPNRRMLTETITALPRDRNASLLVLDIDNMKVINDGLDFETGNQYLLALVERLTSVTRTGTIARLSGDAFAVLVVDTPPGQVERMAHRLVHELAESLEVGQISIARSVSIGVAHNYVARTNDELLAEADAALHQAKSRGKKRVAVFDEAMRAEVLDRFEVEIELRQAIEREEFTLHYQPEVDLDTGEIRAVEALLRWHHPVRGLLTAGAFIETAEESGLVVDIGDQVLRQAIGQLAEWQHDFPDLEMWINISPAQLMTRDVATQIQQLLAEFDVAADRICLEVTEHVVLGDLESTTGILHRLRAMGVKLALDDFGTGYSSMKQLKQLPIDALKIDMTFVAGLGVSEHDSAIVDAAITLAAAFDLGTVAEGVETAQQIAELRQRGCANAQGYLLARPGPPEKVAELLGRPLVLAELA